MSDHLSEKQDKGSSQPYFRDVTSALDASGSRRWIYAKRPSGRYYNWRWIVAILLLTLFLAGPFLRLHGEPLLLLNFIERKFILFGQVFWPQDFHLLVLSIIVLVVFIILFTVTYGRIFCGWACPQTLFMEFVFRQIEYLIEGDANKQRQLNLQDMTLEKLVRKGIKHLVFVFISCWIAFTFYAYVVGNEFVWGMIKAGPFAYLRSFAFFLLLTGFFYVVFAFLREQVCILLCPYGRLQGVLLDDRSVVVAYDYVRGEPRGKLVSHEDRKNASKGDCVDCKACVLVCPTGIDIRNGTQLECINCTACIDACNRVMDRVKLPRGLVRYDSERAIRTGVRKVVSARTVAYSSFLLLLLALTVFLFSMRSEIEITVLRMPGSLYQEYGAHHYSNIYTIQLVNKTRHSIPVELKLASDVGEISYIGDGLEEIGAQVTDATFMVVMPKEAMISSNMPIQLELISGERIVTRHRTNFIGPDKAQENQKGY